MFKDRVNTPEHALVYLVDCTLATVCAMAMKKSRPVGEYSRQKMIAQHGIDWIKEMGIEADSRPKDVIDHCDGFVHKWSLEFDVWDGEKG